MHHYTAKENQIIRDHWHKGPEAVKNMLRADCMSTRTIPALIQHARRIGATTPQRHKWTMWELKLLRDNMSKSNLWLINSIEKEKGYKRTASSIEMMRYRVRQGMGRIQKTISHE